MATNERIHILRESIVKLTQMLAGKGLQVTQRGVSAFVKPDHTGKPILVNLPYLPDNASMELVDAIQGFLDHEVAHILFTDFTVSNKVDRTNGGQFWNSLEDTRIEREMTKRFQGSAENLSRTGKFFLDKYITPRMNEAIASGDNDLMQGILAVPLIRAMAGQQIFKEFMKDKMAYVEPMYEKIKDLAPRIEAISSTQEAADLSKEIVTRLRDGKAPDEEEGEEESKKAKGKGGKSGGKSSKGGKGKSAPKGDPAEEENDEEEKDPSDKDGEEDGEEEEEGEGEPGEGDGGDEGEDDTAENDPDDEGGELVNADSDSSSKSPSGDSKVDISKSSGVSWKAIDKETANDFDKSVSAAISDGAASAATSADYIIYSKDKDVIEPLRVGREFKPSMLTALQNEVEHMVAPLQKDLERAIAARSLSHWSPGHRSGRLHAGNLSRLALGDTRVFRRKEEATSKDVAVELVVDASGSMGGEKITLAAQAAYALAAVLERIGIKCEVICFTTGQGIDDPETLKKEADKIGRQYSRVESLYMPILKGFDERMNTEVKNRFGWLEHSNILRNNVDGECVEIAARRLMARREKGKIMMVLSDGAPHAGGNTRTLGPHLKKVVADVSKTGVKVIGIGIMSDAVRQFYPKHIILNNVNDLPGAVMKELRQLVIS